MTDASKTYVWALSKSSRALIGQLGFDCVTDASELGGAINDIWPQSANSIVTPTRFQIACQVDEVETLPSTWTTENVSAI